jgi:hypothetical protein
MQNKGTPPPVSVGTSNQNHQPGHASNAGNEVIPLHNRLTHDKPKKWGTKSASKCIIKQRLIKLAYMVKPQEHTYWQQIYEFILIAAEYMGMKNEIHEVALPIDHQTIVKWHPEASNWKLPRFNMHTDNMQGALSKEIGRLYTEVTNSHTKKAEAETQFLPWDIVKGEWSACASFFRTYWFLHPELSKKEAFRKALILGEAKILVKSNRLAVEKSLVLDAQHRFHAQKINILLTTSLKRVAPQDSDTRLTHEYYMYKDEALAQVTLTNFFAVKQAKTGTYKDMVAFSKVWITSKNASAADKELYKSFLDIHSAKEVMDQKSKQAGKKRQREEDKQERMQRSRMTIEGPRVHELRESAKLHIRKLAKLQANMRRKLCAKKKKPPKTNGFKAMDFLKVDWDSTWHLPRTVNPGGYIWQMPTEGSKLLSHLVKVHAEIPSLENVDEFIDKGKLCQKVKECESTMFKIRNETRWKGKQVRGLKKLIAEAGKIS